MGEDRKYDRAYIKALMELFAETKEKGETANISDDDLIRIAFSYCNPSADFDAVMDALRRRYGSLRRSFFVPHDELLTVPGVTPQMAMLMFIASKLAYIRNHKGEIYRTPEEYERLFLDVVPPAYTEDLWCAVFDKRDRLINVERIAEGVEIAIDVYMGVMLEFLTGNNSRCMVICHTHPGGRTPAMSESDMLAMEGIGEYTRKLGVSLKGQVVVAGRNAKFFEYIPTEPK